MTAIRRAYSRSKGIWGWILAAVILASPWLTMSGALDIFLELNGIKGEAMHQVHKEKIEVLAWSWGASNSGTTHLGSGSGVGKANFQDLSLTKWIDRASPALLLHLASGKQIPSGKLYVSRVGTKTTDFFTFEMQNIIVTSQSQGASGGEDRMTENITLNFASFTLTYQQLLPDGSPTGLPITTSWNIAENAP